MLIWCAIFRFKLHNSYSSSSEDYKGPGKLVDYCHHPSTKTYHTSLHKVVHIVVAIVSTATNKVLWAIFTVNGIVLR